MADVIAKEVEKYGNDFGDKIITDFIPMCYAYGLAEGKHKDPCPNDKHGRDEWVLNHLAFGKQEQKKEFLDNLIKDQDFALYQEKRKKKLDKLRKSLKLNRTASLPVQRSIKEKTKTS